MKFKKILATVGSVLMLSSVIGGAFAAGLPTTLKADNTVIVQGTGSNDANAISTLQTELSKSATQGAVSVVGGDSFTLEKSSQKLYFGDALDSIYTTLNKDRLNAGLADGVYNSEDVEDVDYRQTITLGSKTLGLFTDSKYENKKPTVGFKFGTSDEILNYTIEFDKDELNASKMKDSDMPLLGEKYFVTSADATAKNARIEMLDSANTLMLEDGAEVTVDGKVISLDWIDGNGNDATFNVDGMTKTVKVGNSVKLDDGSYLSLKRTFTSSRESKTEKVEFSIGSGRIVLENNKEVIIGQDSTDKVRGLWATIDSDGTYINKITLTWKPKETTFLTESNALVMPGFGKIGVSYEGLNYPSESEKISLNGGSDDLVLDMGNYKLPIAWINKTNQGLGEEDHALVITNGSVSYNNAGYDNSTGVLPWTGDENYNNSDDLMSDGLSLKEGERFIVTRIKKDLSDVETLYYELTDIDVYELNLVSITIEDQIGSKDITWSGKAENVVKDEKSTGGDLEVTLEGWSKDTKTAYLSFRAGSDPITYNKVVSEKGLVAQLTTVASNTTTITFREANEDGDVNEGTTFFVTATTPQNDEKWSVDFDTTNISREKESDKQYIGVVKSDLATKISSDESRDQHDFEIEYFGEGAPATVKVSVGGSVSTSIGEAGDLIVADTDAAKMSGKNLIVVGGSAINSVAARLLGFDGPAYGEDFTEKTGVSAGEYLIQSFDENGKVAIVVAGYNAADTENGAKYLALKDYVVGKKYKGTTADVAQEVTA